MLIVRLPTDLERRQCCPTLEGMTRDYYEKTMLLELSKQDYSTTSKTFLLPESTLRRLNLRDEVFDEFNGPKRVKALPARPMDASSKIVEYSPPSCTVPELLGLARICIRQE